MEKISLDQSRCKQCGLCLEHCARGALSFAAEFTASGHRPVQVDESKCIKCGLCYLMCPDRVFTISASPR